VTNDSQSDRQTDHATQKCVGIGRIACAQSLALPRATPHRNSIAYYTSILC